MDIFDTIDQRKKLEKIKKIKKKYSRHLNHLYIKSNFNEIMNYHEFIELAFQTYSNRIDIKKYKKLY